MCDHDIFEPGALAAEVVDGVLRPTVSLQVFGGALSLAAIAQAYRYDGLSGAAVFAGEYRRYALGIGLEDLRQKADEPGLGAGVGRYRRLVQGFEHRFDDTGIRGLVVVHHELADVRSQRILLGRRSAAHRQADHENAQTAPVLHVCRLPCQAFRQPPWLRLVRNLTPGCLLERDRSGLPFSKLRQPKNSCPVPPGCRHGLSWKSPPGCGLKRPG